MRTWTPWETARRQVAIAGRVLDEADRPVARAEVTVAPTGKQPARSPSTQKYASCLADAEGIYYFLDLPAGTYKVTGTDPRSGAARETTVSVAWGKDRKVTMVVADLKLSSAGER